MGFRIRFKLYEYKAWVAFPEGMRCRNVTDLPSHPSCRVSRVAGPVEAVRTPLAPRIEPRDIACGKEQGSSR